MRTLISAVVLLPLIAFGDTANLDESEIALTTKYFDSFQKSLDYYPFTEDLRKIDDAIAGEYSYCWSIRCSWSEACS